MSTFPQRPEVRAKEAEPRWGGAFCEGCRKDGDLLVASGVTLASVFQGESGWSRTSKVLYMSHLPKEALPTIPIPAPIVSSLGILSGWSVCNASSWGIS